MAEVDYETVIVGAGTAGIAAARALRARGAQFVVLEARDRVGGRAYTDTSRFGFAVDLGAQWLHSADVNPLAALARKAGFDVRETPEDWGGGNAARWLDAPRLEDLAATMRSFFAALRAFDPHGDDVPVSALLAGSDWPAVLRAVVTYITGAPPEDVSSADIAADRDTDTDCPVREGVGALVASLAAGLPVRLRCPVTAVDWSSRAVRIETPAGRLRCHRAILTVPTDVLAAGGISFRPALPAAKQAALDDLPLGRNERVVLPVSGSAFEAPADSFHFSSLTDADAPHVHVRPYGRACVSAYFGAGAAREIAALDDAAASAVVTERLCALFGNSARAAVGPGLVTRWQHDPFTRGAYSYARPGRRAARKVLAEPLAERLYFAGEATWPDHYATVHGAFLSGLAAVESLPG